ncbi:hypothetical protein [Micromonospora sagamiensis]|uniref:Uncharacterized protein n=1 Tax=Micromonospora sagamiensis TaxID=47875 RepID=A0A562WM14_9ACTN|nr:hypothetical protein [Micromonospora sagamiensis]TWJ31340.1 hypothetical protein JD81_04895 [Micromonospora sagamiensis]BCL15614.1 hypothetical protein GCM10017556_33530 [Micromonospora sagamiensis]
MGYLVVPSGRLHLPQSDEAAAAAAAMTAMTGRSGWFDPGDPTASQTLTELGRWVAASIERDGDWIEFGPEDLGDAKWSEQAEAFYRALAPFVRSGTVHIEGEDGGQWSYTYADGQVTEAE